jgi:trk system potassium uptake protein
MNINFQPVSNVVGVLLLLLASGMFVTAGVASYNISEDYVYFLQSGAITSAVGFLFWLYNFGQTTQVKKREGYLIVALGWIFMSGFGAFLYFRISPDLC